MNNGLKLQHRNGDENCEMGDLYSRFRKAIQKIAEDEGYVSYNINTNKISADGGNYFGVLYEINIKGETTEENKQEINLFVKHVIPNSDNIKFISVSDMYNNERFVYTELAKVFTKLQDKAIIPIEKRLNFVKIYDYGNIDTIILENLTKIGFKTYSKMDMMNLDYAELCIKELAKFHSLAFLVERMMPEFFRRNIKTLKLPLAIDSAYKASANTMYELATKKLSPELKFKTDKWWKTAIDNYSKFLQGKMTAVKCLCHGDFKSNNVMYKEIEGRITEVKIVDYQLVHYGSPVLDFIYFICLGTDQKFRRNHLNHLKDYYHMSLKNILEYFDVHVDDIYPRKVFEEDFEDCLNYGLICSICILPFSLTTGDGSPDFADTENIHLALKLDDTYYDRLQGIFDDYFK